MVTALSEDLIISGMTMDEIRQRALRLVEKLREGEVNRDELVRDFLRMGFKATLQLMVDEDIRAAMLELSMQQAEFAGRLKGNKLYFETSITEPVIVEFKSFAPVRLASRVLLLGGRIATLRRFSTRAITRMASSRVEYGQETAGGLKRLFVSGLSRLRNVLSAVKVTRASRMDIMTIDIPGFWIDIEALAIIFEEAFPARRGPRLIGEGIVPMLAVIDQGGLIKAKNVPLLVRWLGGWEQLTFFTSKTGVTLDELIFTKQLLVRLGEILPPLLEPLLARHGC